MIAIRIRAIQRRHIHRCPILQIHHPDLRIRVPNRELPISGFRVHQETPIGRDTGKCIAQAIRMYQRIDREADLATIRIERDTAEIITYLIIILRHLLGRGRTEIKPFTIRRERGESLECIFCDQ